MSDTESKPEGRQYVVLYRGDEGLVERGDYVASSADGAIRAHVEDFGTPGAGNYSYVAVPVSNWNERTVTTRTEPVYEVGPVIVHATATLTEDPAPEPIMGGMDTQGAD